jgi:hypothetical protein
MKTRVDYTPKPKKDPILDRRYSSRSLNLRQDNTYKPPKEEYRATTKHIPSRETPGHSTAPKVIPECNLPNLLGVSIVHKSCLQPVFSEQQAKDLASMRR